MKLVLERHVNGFAADHLPVRRKCLEGDIRIVLRNKPVGIPLDRRQILADQENQRLFGIVPVFQINQHGKQHVPEKMGEVAMSLSHP